MEQIILSDIDKLFQQYIST